MPAPSLKEQIARTDNTFERADRSWVGKCLICNGRLSFDARGGFGANIEHIVPRTEGGANDLLNLGLTHPHCNAEKGRNWDNRKKRSDSARYEALVGGFLARRNSRWRDPLPEEDIKDARRQSGGQDPSWYSDTQRSSAVSSSYPERAVSLS